MKEIKDAYQQFAAKLQSNDAKSSKKSKSESSAGTPSSSSTEKEGLNGRVLVYVKDERTAMHVRDILAFGLAYVMDQRHRWFVSQQAADIRQKYQPPRKVSTSTAPSSSDPNKDSVIASNPEALLDDHMGLGISKNTFDRLSEESKLMLFHVSFYFC